MHTLLLALALALPALSPGTTTGPIAPYDGSNPFDCTVQQAGTGSELPDPDADPRCVAYDKTNQHVAGLGIVDFLLAEPGRVAAAADACFYYQRDHWRSAVDPRAEVTEVYRWDGGYYFDKARGAVGVHVENLTLNGRSVDPTALPGFPPRLEPYFGDGRGGFQVIGRFPVAPRCAARAEHG